MVPLLALWAAVCSCCRHSTDWRIWLQVLMKVTETVARSALCVPIRAGTRVYEQHRWCQNKPQISQLFIELMASGTTVLLHPAVCWLHGWGAHDVARANSLGLPATCGSTYVYTVFGPPATAVPVQCCVVEGPVCLCVSALSLRDC